MSANAEASKGRVLLVDDDATLLRGHARVLERAGYEVVTALDGAAALAALTDHPVDAVVSDISMPGMDGLTLLRAIRARDLDLPVILITGQPALDTAIEAIRHGALRYLIKPAPVDSLVRETQRAVNLYRWAKLRRTAHVQLGGDPLQAGDRAGIHARFESALATLWTAFQPIVSCAERRVAAYEALLRTGEASLPHPGAVLEAADRLDRADDLGRAVRAHVAAALDVAAHDTPVFVNLQVRDLLDPTLYAPDAPLNRHARRVVLEITERESLDALPDVKERVARLRALGYRIAIDDLGAGYSSLTSFAQLEPEVVKLDMALVRGVEQSPVKQRLVASFVTLGRDLGLMLVCEGVETLAEYDALRALGCDVFQGYLFARPGKPFPEVTWPA